MRDLVLVGGGHSHIEVLRQFGMRPAKDTRITLVSERVDTPYSGMLPGLIAGHYTYDETHIDLQRLCRFAGARFVRARADGLEPFANRLRLRDRPPLHYDVLSINIGSTPSVVPGAREHAIPVKPISSFHSRWTRLREEVAEGCRIAVVGGGAGGVEVLLAAQHAIPDASFVLVTKGAEILSSHARGARTRFREILSARNVSLETSWPVARVEPGQLVSESASVIAFDHCLWATRAGPQQWLAEAGLATDDDGFMSVDATLASISHANVFAAGDIAHVVHHPRPKSGVFAVRQGPPLADNLRRRLAGEELVPFVPQKRFLSLISTGDKQAVATRGGVVLGRGMRKLWALKDRIDRRFMEKYTDLPVMEPSEEGEDEMRCGGCGAKVGASVLSRVVSELSRFSREDVEVGLDQPDDAAVIALGGDRRLVQSVDFFRDFVGDPYVLGEIAANHALGDIYAMGAEPHSALALVTVPHGDDAQVESDLAAVMAGASKVLSENRCALLGGHTAEGAELAVGFAVNGMATGNIWPKGGAREGDELLLTKPIGTGTLFAADMRGQARGAWIDAALGSMRKPRGPAVEVLRRHKANAVTDVTGFGLLGHLAEMLKAANISAELFLDKVPLLEGALECAQAGLYSSLQPQNHVHSRLVDDREAWRGDPLFELLVDPQTAGGLLASVPAERAAAAAEDLANAGYKEVARIGRMVPVGARPAVLVMRDRQPS